MTLALNEPKFVGEGYWEFSWVSSETDPNFKISKNGEHLMQTRLTRAIIACDEADHIEISDDDSDPQDGSEAKLEVTWPAVAGADSYRVEQETSPGSGVWLPRAKIKANSSGKMAYRTPALADDTATVFRITPIGTNGNDGTPTTVNVTVPRHPSAPEVAYSFSDVTAKVTIAAA